MFLYLYQLKYECIFYQDTTTLISEVYKNLPQDLAIVILSVKVPNSLKSESISYVCISYRSSHTMASIREQSRQRKSNLHTDSKWLLPNEY